MWLKRETEAPQTVREQATCVLFHTRSLKCSLVKLVGVHLCSFQRQTLIETWGGRWPCFLGVMNRVCAVAACTGEVCKLSPFFPRMAHQANTRGWFFSPLSANASMHLHQHTAFEKTTRLLKCRHAPVSGDWEIRCCPYKWILNPHTPKTLIRQSFENLIIII